MANGYTCLFVNFEFFSVASHFLAHIYRSVFIVCMYYVRWMEKKSTNYARVPYSLYYYDINIVYVLYNDS